MAIRGMANLPVESMKTGGLYWFTNLTIPDPFYLLPVMTCTTLLIAIEVNYLWMSEINRLIPSINLEKSFQLGAESGVRLDSMQMMRYALRCLPLVIFPFVINFPAVSCSLFHRIVINILFNKRIFTGHPLLLGNQ